MRAVVDLAWDGNARVGYIVITSAVGLEKGNQRFRRNGLVRGRRELSSVGVTRRDRKRKQPRGSG